MLNKIRYAYHLSVCEHMIKNYTYIDHTTYKLTKRYKWHMNKLHKLMVTINRKARA